jgi:hypothetical protein
MADSSSATKRRRPGGVWNADIEFFLCQAQAMLGPRGSSASVENQLERGGPSVGSLSVRELCDDEQLGWGRWKGRSSIARYRSLEPLWLALPKAHQDVLVAYYRTTEGQRALEGENQDAQDTAGLPRRVRNELGQLAGVAYLLTPVDHWPALCAACEALDRKSYERRRSELVPQAKRRDEAAAQALTAVAAAHDAWAELRHTLKSNQEREQLVQKVSARAAARAARQEAVERFRADLEG